MLGKVRSKRSHHQRQHLIVASSHTCMHVQVITAKFVLTKLICQFVKGGVEDHAKLHVFVKILRACDDAVHRILENAIVLVKLTSSQVGLTHVLFGLIEQRGKLENKPGGGVTDKVGII